MSARRGSLSPPPRKMSRTDELTIPNLPRPLPIEALPIDASTKLNRYSKEAESLLRPHSIIPSAEHQKLITDIRNQHLLCFDRANSFGVTINQAIGKDQIVFEMTGGIIKTRSEFGWSPKADESGKRHLIEIAGIPLCLEMADGKTSGIKIRRSCRPSCRLTYFFGQELHIFVTTNRPLDNKYVTLPMEPDYFQSVPELKCANHFNVSECREEGKRLKWINEKHSIKKAAGTPLKISPQFDPNYVESPDSAAAGEDNDVEIIERVFDTLPSTAPGSSRSSEARRVPGSSTALTASAAPEITRAPGAAITRPPASVNAAAPTITRVAVTGRPTRAAKRAHDTPAVPAAAQLIPVTGNAGRVAITAARKKKKSDAQARAVRLTIRRVAPNPATTAPAPVPRRTASTAPRRAQNNVPHTHPTRAASAHHAAPGSPTPAIGPVSRHAPRPTRSVVPLPAASAVRARGRPRAAPRLPAPITAPPSPRRAARPQAGAHNQVLPILHGVHATREMRRKINQSATTATGPATRVPASAGSSVRRSRVAPAPVPTGPSTRARRATPAPAARSNKTTKGR